MNVRLVKALAVLLTVLAVATVSSGAAAVKLVIWDYVTWRVEYYQQFADEYMKANPDVEIEVQLVPQGEYVDKILIGAVSGAPPAAFAGHPVWIGNFAGLLEPFPHDLFPPDKLSQELLAYEQLLQDGHAYYYPLGMQGPVLFINLDHWEQAGLSEAPRTWEDALAIGRKTTRRVEGATQLAGFVFHDEFNELFIDLIYQQGGKMYKGPTQVAFDEPFAIQAISMINDWYAERVSGTGGEGIPFDRTVLRHIMAYRQQQLNQLTDVRWTVAPVPTIDGSFHEGMSKMDYYLGLAVPKGNSPEVMRATFEFIHWMYSDDEKVMDLNSRSGTLPARMSLWSHPEVVTNPVLKQLTETLPYSTSPGQYPQWIKESLAPVRNAIFGRTADPVVLLGDVTRQINIRLIEEPVQWIAE